MNWAIKKISNGLAVGFLFSGNAFADSVADLAHKFELLGQNTSEGKEKAKYEQCLEQIRGATSALAVQAREKIENSLRAKVQDGPRFIQPDQAASAAYYELADGSVCYLGTYSIHDEAYKGRTRLRLTREMNCRLKISGDTSDESIFKGVVEGSVGCVK